VSAKLNTREVGDVTVVDVSGRITLGEGSSAMRDTLARTGERREKEGSAEPEAM